MTDYQQLQMSAEVSLNIIQEAINFEATLQQPNYERSLQQLYGISLILIPFPELKEKVDSKINELQELRGILDLSK